AVVPAPAAPYISRRAAVMNQEIRFCTAADGARLAYALSGKGPPLAMSPACGRSSTPQRPKRPDRNGGARAQR
ncbi:MAG TPA: hypothetical protein VFL51_11065, partial [Pseudolabrys sp.]|nr:hypothetical protein [Pseudolabrys sp.]